MESQSNGKSERSKRNFTSESYIPGMISFCKFLAVVGYIGIAILVIAGLHAFSQFGHGEGSTIGIALVIGFLFILGAAFCVYPVYKLTKFISLAKAALYYEDENLLATALKNLKNAFRYTGILVVLAFLYFFFVTR